MTSTCIVTLAHLYCCLKYFRRRQTCIPNWAKCLKCKCSFTETHTRMEWLLLSSWGKAMRTGCHHQVERIKWRGKTKLWGLPKPKFIFFKCFFVKASHCACSNRFVCFWCLICNPNATLFLWMTWWLLWLTHSSAGWVQYSGPGSVFDLLSVLWSWLPLSWTSHFIKLKTPYDMFLNGFQGGMQGVHNHSGWINIYWTPRISDLAATKDLGKSLETSSSGRD